METNEHYIAYTIINKDKDGRIKFLVETKEGHYSFPVASAKSRNTALACVIKHLKECISLNVDNLELSELTNAVVRRERIPLYVFSYERTENGNSKVAIKDKDHLKWVYYEEFISTFDEWEIEGVPLLSTDYI